MFNPHLRNELIINGTVEILEKSRNNSTLVDMGHLGFVLHTWIKDTNGYMVTAVLLWVEHDVILRFSVVFPGVWLGSE